MTNTEFTHYGKEEILDWCGITKSKYLDSAVSVSSILASKASAANARIDANACIVANANFRAERGKIQRGTVYFH